MNRLPTPQPPQTPDRWAWERFYTDTVEYLMTARSGERTLKPSEVAEAAKARTIAAFVKATGQEQAPAWLAQLGDPPADYYAPPSGSAPNRFGGRPHDPTKH